ncbi:hypothetical protein BD413DRAFT_673689 [Trametes elegans]|nr:hypothetical protein BD413DRAFT_673689 [Trametes elegans]
MPTSSGTPGLGARGQGFKHRMSLPRAARAARQGYIEVFGDTPSPDSMREFHRDLIELFGASEEYPLKDLQNWFSKQRARRKAIREPTSFSVTQEA